MFQNIFCFFPSRSICNYTIPDCSFIPKIHCLELSPKCCPSNFLHSLYISLDLSLNMHNLWYVIPTQGIRITNSDLTPSHKRIITAGTTWVLRCVWMCWLTSVNIKVEKQVCLETQEIFAAELTSLSTGSAFGNAPEKALLQTQKRSPRSGIFTV